MPIMDRIGMIFSGLLLTIIPIVCLSVPLYKNDKELIMILLFLFAMLLYCVFVYYSVFKIYICLDIIHNTIVIREFPGCKKDELSMHGLIDLKVSDGTPLKNKCLFTLDINFDGYTKYITSWSVGPGSLPFLGSYRAQRKRLEKFCEQCNKYLNNRVG